MNNNWIIFGASTFGKKALQSNPERNWIGFIDNDPVKWGSNFCGLPVISLKDYQNKTSIADIVIASQFQIEIIEQLLENNILNFEIYWPTLSSNLENKNKLSNFQKISLPHFLEKKEESLTLLIHNNSGSNTLALKKTNSLARLDYKVNWHHEMIKSQAYIEDIFKSKYIVTTHDKVLPKLSSIIQLWHGFPLKGLNYMSRHQAAKAREDTHLRWLKYSAITSYSATYTSLINSCYGVNVEQYSITGMPRNDLLFFERPKEKLEKIVNKEIKGRKIILYMPTFRKTKFGQVNGDDELQPFGLIKFDREHLFKFLEDNELILVIKPHPYQDDFGLGEQDKLPESIWTITDSLLIENDLDFYEVLAAADLLITDYSSVYFDYLLLDKPIIFTPADSEIYNKNRGFLVEPYEFWAPGPKCYQQQELQSTIITQLEKPKSHAKEREKIRRIVHYYNDDQSSVRVANLIEKTIRK